MKGREKSLDSRLLLGHTDNTSNKERVQFLCLFYLLIGFQAIKRKMDILVRNCLIARANKYRCKHEKAGESQYFFSPAETYKAKSRYMYAQAYLFFYNK